MPPKIELNSRELDRLYHDEGLSLSAIADRFGCSTGTIYNRMEEYGIPRRLAKQYHVRVSVACTKCGTRLNRQRWQFEKYANHFCDNECQGEYLQETGLVEGERNPHWKEKTTVACDNCGAEKSLRPSRVNEDKHYFCDNDCRGEWQSENLRGENSPLWEDGGEPKYYTGAWLAARQRARERDGGICRLCGLSAEVVHSGRELDVHHLRPIRDFSDGDDAHHLDNLAQVCRRCHGILEPLSLEHQRELLGGPNLVSSAR